MTIILNNVYFRTERIPVLFIFGKEKIDIDCCSDSFKNCFPEEHSKIILIYDVLYHHAIGEDISVLCRSVRDSLGLCGILKIVALITGT